MLDPYLWEASLEMLMYRFVINCQQVIKYICEMLTDENNNNSNYYPPVNNNNSNDQDTQSPPL